MSIKKLKDFLESNYTILLTLEIGLISWLVKSSVLCVISFAVLVSLIFIICNDPKGAFPSLFFISFFIQVIDDNYPLAIYLTCIFIVLGSIIYFIIKTIKSKKCTKGRLFYPMIIADIAFLLGGIIGNFNIINIACVLFMALCMYLFYWITINTCTDLKQFMYIVLTCGGFIICIQFIVLNLYTGKFISSIQNQSILYIGAQNKNVAALFITIGMIACLTLAQKRKYDYLYFLLASFMVLVCALTLCRTMILLSILFYIGLSINVLAKSNNKIIFSSIIGGLVLVSLGIGISTDLIYKLIDSVVEKINSGMNGRSELWAWCLERFIKHPLLGYGFISPTPVPTITGDFGIILAHNTPLQLLTSTGVIGTILIGYFYFAKYKLCTENKDNRFLFLIIIMIELSGLTDQAACMDPFICLVIFGILGTMEIFNKPNAVSENENIRYENAEDKDDKDNKDNKVRNESEKYENIKEENTLITKKTKRKTSHKGTQKQPEN